MITLTERDGNYWPHIFCDYCNERIADAEKGIFVWFDDDQPSGVVEQEGARQ